MKTLAAAIALLAAALSAAAPVPRGTVNLVTNGSFEDVSESEASKPLDKGSAALKGWVVTRGQIDLTQQNGDQWKAAHGKRGLDLHGSPGLGGVKQTIATRAGATYRVTFKMSGNPGVPGLDTVQLAVRAAGADKTFELPMAGRTYEDLKWEEKAWEFRAAGAETELEFHTGMPATANPWGGPLLDDVKVTRAD